MQAWSAWRPRAERPRFSDGVDQPGVADAFRRFEFNSQASHLAGPTQFAAYKKVSAASTETADLIKTSSATALRGLQDYNNKFLEFAHTNSNAAFGFMQKLHDVELPSEFMEYYRPSRYHASLEILPIGQLLYTASGKGESRRCLSLVKGNIAAAEIGAVHLFEENLVGAAVDYGNIHFPAHFLSFRLAARGDLFCQIQ